MDAEDWKKIEGEPDSRAHRMSHQDYLGWLLFFMSGVRFRQVVVQQAVHYAQQVLPPEDERERVCLAAEPERNPPSRSAAIP